LHWTLTLNAVVDHVYRPPVVAVDSPIVEQAYHLLSGKGLNVSRALACLGHLSTAVILCGPDTADAYRLELRRLGVLARLVPALERTRQHVTVVRTPGRPEMHLRERGAASRPEAWELLLRGLSDVGPGDVVAFSGSSAPGIGAAAVAELLRAIAGRGASVWIDTSGEPLRLCLEQRPSTVKVNASEIAAALGSRVTSPAAAAAAARHLLAEGIQLVCITMGKHGLVLAQADAVVFAPAPSLSVASPVGSGDAVMAALLAGALEPGVALADLAASAAAAGAANALNHTPGLLDRCRYLPLVAAIRPLIRAL